MILIFIIIMFHFSINFENYFLFFNILKEKQKNKNNEQSNKDSVNELKIQKGETLGAFSK